MKRSIIDFSHHEVLIERENNLLVHYIKKPNTITNSVKFINTNGILAVTGDFGNWIFCREFHPSAGGSVSDGYWIEKLINSSIQEPMIYDERATEVELTRMLNGGIEEYGWDGDEAEEMKEYFQECLAKVDDRFEYEHFAYRSLPSFTDHEQVVYCKIPQPRLDIIFDAFDEICGRLKAKQEVLKPNHSAA